MARDKTIIVYSVLYYDPKSAGPAGDCTHTMRFRREPDARAFAAGKTLYGQPATVERDEVPQRIAQRWSIVN